MNEDGHQEVFRGWLARHQGLLLKVLRVYAVTPHDQEDLFQEMTIAM